MARSRGWAGSRSERTPGIRAVAAPIFDHSGAAIGALGLSVPEVRMDDARAEELGDRVHRERVGDLRGRWAPSHAAVEATVRGREPGAAADLPRPDLPAAGSPPAGPPLAGRRLSRPAGSAGRDPGGQCADALDRDRDVVPALQ